MDDISHIFVIFVAKTINKTAEPMNNCPQNGVDCSQCTLSKSEGTLMLHHFAQCTHFSAEKQSTNFILFILEGEMLINS